MVAVDHLAAMEAPAIRQNETHQRYRFSETVKLSSAASSRGE